NISDSRSKTNSSSVTASITRASSAICRSSRSRTASLSRRRDRCPHGLGELPRLRQNGRLVERQHLPIPHQNTAIDDRRLHVFSVAHIYQVRNRIVHRRLPRT